MTNFKQKKIRSEKHRRFIASLPCLKCGKSGTQAAHVGGMSEGKGIGVKVCDSRCVPLCAPYDNEMGCHFKHDNMDWRTFWGKKLDRLDDLMNALYAKSGDIEHAYRAIRQFQKGEW